MGQSHTPHLRGSRLQTAGGHDTTSWKVQASLDSSGKSPWSSVFLNLLGSMLTRPELD